MQTLLTILYLCGAAGYLGLIGFVFTCNRRQKKTEELLVKMGNVVAKIYCFVSMQRLENRFENFGRLKQQVSKLTDEDRFEDAAKLKIVIDKMEKDAYNALEEFKEHFGNDNVVLTEIPL